MTTIHIPRWYHNNVSIPEGTTQRVPSELFSNDTAWPMRLHWIAVQYASAFYNTFFEVGITQLGDINYTPIFHAGMFCSGQEYTLDCGSPASYMKFPVPIKLGPEKGIVAEVTNTNLEGGSGGQDTSVFYPSILFNGTRKGKNNMREPVQLAGCYYAHEIIYPQKVNISSPDLFNNGEDSIELNELLIQSGMKNVPLSQKQRDLSWRINPTAGTPWMPRPDPIPAGLIAPFRVMTEDFGPAGTTDYPHVYVLPEGTMLYPRQRVIFEINTTSGLVDDINDMGICVFGTLEAK